MKGVKSLSTGLELYKGKAKNSDQSYIGSYGKKGKAYYKWQFSQLTGIEDPDIGEIYDDIYKFYSMSYIKCAAVMVKIAEYEDTDHEIYDEFYDYYDNNSVYLDLEEPHDILDYLKEAAKTIVPDLKSAPEIDFKYMDETAGKISNTLAYYYLSPIDDKGSREYITLNSVQIENNEESMLTLLAHEGYPGHLYAHAYSKEQNLDLLTAALGKTAFAEGWAQYVEGAVLDYVASTTDSEAVKLYCEYDKYSSMFDYASSLISDILINYYGYTIDELVEDGFVRDGLTDEQKQNYMSVFSEHPLVYVSYGYGRYYMEYLHDTAKSELGDKYDEVKFNGMLLSEGEPTFARAEEMTEEFIKANK